MTIRRQMIIYWTFVAAAIGLLMFTWQSLPIDGWIDPFKIWVAQLGSAAPLVFGAIYVAATVLLIPASAITLAGGAVFGLTLGFFVVSISSIIGASISFLIARYLTRPRVERWAHTNPRIKAIDQAISQGGWRVLGLMRLSPAIPFGLQNYLHGITPIPFWQYVLVSWIAMIPGTFMYVYLGYAAGTAASGHSGSVAKTILLIIGLAATIAVTVYITRLAQQNLASLEQEPADD